MLEYLLVHPLAKSALNLPDIVHVEPRSLEEVHAVLAFLHAAIVRISLRMEQAVHLVAFHAGLTLEAFFVRLLIVVTRMPCRCIHHAVINSPFKISRVETIRA
jgi:hypothetical protein